MASDYDPNHRGGGMQDLPQLSPPPLFTLIDQILPP